jgi:hypothetical protein
VSLVVHDSEVAFRFQGSCDRTADDKASPRYCDDPDVGYVDGRVRRQQQFIGACPIRMLMLAATLRLPTRYDDGNDAARQSIRAVTMNLRHAAALSLVGWYLMTPPCRSVNSRPNSGYGSCFMDSQTPLREWVRVPDTEEFEYKTDCLRAISNSCHSEVEADGTTSLEGDLCGADCIAADDPRLKEK